MGSPAIDHASLAQPPTDSTKKLDQIIQNYHTKVAALVLDSRIKVTPTRLANGNPKMNKWFQLETEDIEDFKEEMKVWKNCGSFDHRPPPMIIEVYLDASSLKESQSLVIVDENGKRWDVLEHLNTSQFLNASDSSSAPARPKNEVILERWRVELDAMSDIPSDDFGPILPTVYKKAIVFFRSLFVTTKLLPAWRVDWADARKRGPDLLRSPIDGRREPVTDYSFGDLELPVGRLCTSVTYRNDCNFRVDDSESLLSSRFMGVDENFFKPSLPPRLETKRFGSLREHRRHHSSGEHAHQTYGSLSTFHGEIPIGTSPLSALRAVRSPDSDNGSPRASTPSQADAAAVAGLPFSLPISGRSIATRTRPEEEYRRRPSISFQPFKAGSLSDSPVPRHPELESPASANSLTRPGGLPALQIRTRSSLTAGMPASLRGGPNPPANTDFPASGSPRPASASRYSSSFTHRRSRPSIGGASKTGDEENSSGRQSLSNSAAQPGSGFLAEIGAASYGSLQTDEDDISDFLKALDSKKTLRSFEPARKGESTASRTVAQLSKFQMMKESNNALTESMTSSTQLQRSSMISSRHLANLAGTSTSPGKPASPHTAHTPAIPSRLSENSIIDYAPSHGRHSSRGHSSQQFRGGSRSSGKAMTTQDGTTAIDIPLSPRLDSYQRRASSVAQQVRAAVDDEADIPYAAHRSISLGEQDREAPTLSVLLGRKTQAEDDGEETLDQRGEDSGRLQPAAEIETTGSPRTGTSKRESAADTPPSSLIPPAQGTSSFQRRRYGGMASITGHRPTPPQSARASFNGSAGRAVRPDDEVLGEEPLVFTLSEMDAMGRRSVEEGRHGAGQGSSNRPQTFEPRGITRRGWAE
ncbi:Autophagy-related protein 13 [Escovopsis weberi]|uniref:Autophagy-related protein 13 n=1 Tax=Escovopsis weberi TaxID=150374 RepID=A0A0M8MSA9_ESCWE|nr:Autophagy-related protein 13 [Escovopsis weberi]